MNNEGLYFSILIPAYNSKDYIAYTISSALKQKYDNVEIVVLDDFSDDGTWDVIQSFYNKLDDFNKTKVRIFRNSENIGRTLTYRKLLYDLARGKWVLMMDGDDYFVESNFFKKAKELIKKYPQMVALAGGYIKKKGNLEKVKIPEERYFPDGINVSLSYPDIIYAHGAVLYRRDIALSIDGYRAGIISDDLETHLRLFSCGGVYFVNEVVYVWRIHGQNQTSSINYEVYTSNIKKMISMVSEWLSVNRKDKINEITGWKNKCFLKLYRISLFEYSLVEKISLFKIMKDIRDFFDFFNFIKSGLALLIPCYLILPSFLIRSLKKLFKKI